MILTFLFFLNSNAEDLDPEKFETIDINGVKIISPKSIESADELKKIFKDIAAQHTKKSTDEVAFETINLNGIKITYPKGIIDSKEVISNLDKFGSKIVQTSHMTPNFKNVNDLLVENDNLNRTRNAQEQNSIIYQNSIFNKINEAVKRGSDTAYNRTKDSRSTDYTWEKRVAKDFATIDFLDEDCNTHETKLFGINDLGHIVGIYKEGDRWIGFLTVEGEYYQLDFNVNTYPRGINNNGFIVGNYSDGAENSVCFIYKYDINSPHEPGELSYILTELAGYNPTVKDINDKDQIIGYIDMPQVIIFSLPLPIPKLIEVPFGFQLGNGGELFSYPHPSTDIVNISNMVGGGFATFGTYASGINNHSEIVGTHAYIYNALPIAFKKYGNDYSTVTMHYAQDINDNGVIAGYGTPADGNTLGAIQYANGDLKAFNFPNTSKTYALGINKFNTVVGYYKDTEGKIHGFVTPGYDNGFRTRCHGWNFGNDVKNIWPKRLYKNINYRNPPFGYFFWKNYNNWKAPPNSTFPDWFSFAFTYTNSACYNDPIGLRSPKHKAVMHWWLLSSRTNNWPGACYGFALSSLFYYNYFPHVKINKVPLEDFIIDIIIQKYLYQYDGASSNSGHYKFKNDNSKKTPDQTLIEIKKYLSSDDSSKDDRMLLTPTHALVPYRVDIDKVNPNIEYIYLYDNNFPYNSKNNSPDEYIQKITINKHNKTWLLPAGVPNRNYGNQAYKNGLILSEPMSAYVNQPHFRKSSNVSNRTEKNYIAVYTDINTSVYINNNLGKSIGYVDNEVFNNFIDGIPIIPITGSPHPPIGYYIPNEPYSIQMQDCNYTSTYLSVFSDSIIYNYNRSDTDASQTDYFSYGEGFEIRNEDPQSKKFDFETIISADDNEKILSLSTSLSKNESIHFNVVNGNNLKIDYNGAAKNYNLWIRYVSQLDDCEINFIHDNVSLPANSFCQIVPFWDDLRVQGVQILIDYNSDGTTDNSLILPNKATPLLVTGLSQLDLSNENGKISFDVCNIGGGAMEWTAQTNDSWISIQNGNSGINHGVVSINYPENTHGARIGYIKIIAPSAVNNPAIIEFRQKGIISEPATITASDGIHSDKIQIDWKAVEEANYYKIYRSTDSNSYGIELTEWITNTHFNDISAKPDQTYYYRIKSADSVTGNNESWYSNSEDGWRSCPSANFRTQQNTCFGEIVEFNDLSVKTDIGTNYEWDIDNDGTVDYTTSGNISHHYESPGKYIAKLNIVNSAGCSDSITRTINIIPPPDIDLENDIKICRGEAIEIDDAFFSYNWSNGLSKTNRLTVDSSGTYSVTIMDGNFCSNTHTFNVIVDELPVVNLGKNTSICKGKSILLDAGKNFASYNWNNGLSNEQTLVVSESGTYLVEVSDGNGCTNKDEITVTYRTLDEAVISPDGLTKLCEGDTVVLNANNDEGYTYQWKKDGRNIYGANKPSYTVHEQGIYTVEISNCASTKISEGVQVTVYSIETCPVADFTTNETTISAGTVINFTDKTVGHPTSWSWIFHGGEPEVSNEQNPAITYKTSGNYDVTLTVTVDNDNRSDNITKTSYIKVINDASVKYVYTLGKLPISSGSPHVIYAIIRNGLDSVLTDFDVTLNITGTNTFTDVQTISDIAPGKETYVYFASFTPNNLGDNIVTVSIPHDDDNINNSQSYTQVVTENTYSYADDSKPIWSYGHSSYIFMNKYHINGKKAVTAVNVHISFDRNNVGQTAYAVVLDGSANILARSDDFIISESDLSKMHTFRIKENPVINNSYFYVGIAVPSGSCNPVGAQPEPGGRKSAYYLSYLEGKTIQEQTDVNRWVIEAIVADTIPTLSVSPNSITLEAISDRFAINIMNKGIEDMSWTAFENVDWLSIDKTEGTNYDSIIVKCESNSGNARDAIITINADGAKNSPQQIKIFQKASSEMIGDVNGDNVINIIDIVSLLQLLADNYEFSNEWNMDKGDIIKDGKLDLMDGISIFRIISE